MNQSNVTIPETLHFNGIKTNKETDCTCKNDIEINNKQIIKKKIIRKRFAHQIPDSIQNDIHLNKAIAALPWNYNFEIKKTIWKIKQVNAKMVALQFPEGLLMYSCIISDIIERFTEAICLILGDVTYGACCVDDLSAIALGADFLVHYGHSCLVPIDVTTIKTLYVFVDILIDTKHLVDCIKLSFPTETKIAIMGTIQFAGALNSVYSELKLNYPHIKVPQAKPLSSGEVLGCTSPVLLDIDVLVFIADGRFHLESAMIANPSVKAFRYDPYSKILSKEEYMVEEMKLIRKDAIDKARYANYFGIVLGTLGRQGNPAILERMINILKNKNKTYIIVLFSELFPKKLAMFKEVDSWIQIACPRLSIDWGYAFDKPLLTSYEAEVCLNDVKWKESYPMDYYAKDSGSWTNYFKEEKKT